MDRILILTSCLPKL